MHEMQSWFYVFAEKTMLRDAGIADATPVSFDPTTGKIEILDDSANCSEWVVRATDTREAWAEKLKAYFGVKAIYMDASIVVDFTDEYVRVSAAGQRLLFTEPMEDDFEQLMFSVW